MGIVDEGFEGDVHVHLIRHGLRVLSSRVVVEVVLCMGLDKPCSVLLLGLGGVPCLHDLVYFLICESDIKVFCLVCCMFRCGFVPFPFSSRLALLGFIARGWDWLRPR